MVDFKQSKMQCIDLERVASLELISSKDVKNSLDRDPLIKTRPLTDIDGWISLSPESYESLQNYIDSLKAAPCEGKWD